MTILDMLQGEIDTIRKKFLDKWTFKRHDAVQIMIGISFEDRTTHFILPDRNASFLLMGKLNQLVKNQKRWDDDGNHKDTFNHPLDNLQPFITDKEFHIE